MLNSRRKPEKQKGKKMKLNEILEAISVKQEDTKDYYSEIYKMVDMVVIQAKILGERVATVVIEKDPDFGCFKVNGDECPQYFEDELDDMVELIKEHLVSEGIDREKIKTEYTDVNEWEILVCF